MIVYKYSSKVIETKGEEWSVGQGGKGLWTTGLGAMCLLASERWLEDKKGHSGYTQNPVIRP